MKKNLTIVSRKSPLALWQATFVKKQLEQYYPDLAITIVGVQTQGDLILDIPLAKIGGKGLFVKTLEEQLLEHHADIAVHSLKDMPTEQPEGLELYAILERDDPRDAMISLNASTFTNLPLNACVGTSSLRRQAQLLALRKDLIPKTLRGNVNTRLQKLTQGEYDAIILAVSGLKRLGVEHHISQTFSPALMLPAIGQGALCIECRSDDLETKNYIAPLKHQPTTQCAVAERSLLHTLEGNCQSPIAGFATLKDNHLTLQGRVAKPDGSVILSAQKTEHKDNAQCLGKQVAEALFAQGAKAIIHECQTV